VYYLSTLEDFVDQLVVSFAFICCLLCYLASAAYHLFKNLGENACSILLHVDYAGIVLATLGLQTACCYYSFHCFPHLKYFYPTVSILLSIPTLLFVVAPNLGGIKIPSSGKVRMTTFIAFTGFGFIPLFHFMFTYYPVFVDELPEASGLFLSMFTAYGFFVAGMLIWACRFPECLWVGKFDIWASSHQWWHVAVSMGTVQFLWVVVQLCSTKNLFGATSMCKIEV
jgi:adiponectin receptor